MSKQGQLRLILLALVLCMHAGVGAARANSLVLPAELNQAVARAGNSAPELSVHVVSLPDGGPVYSYASDELRIIASNTKLFTTAAALDRLGPGYFHETPLLIEGAIVEGRLAGNVAVMGSGDPNISGRHYGGDPLAVFRGWARRLGELGIEEIGGDVLLAHGLFDDARVHHDWPRDQLARWYEAPVEAISFSDNCVLVRIRPGAQVGEPARVELVPGVPTLGISNEATTTNSRRRHRLAVDRAPDSDIIRVSGQILAGSDPIDVWVTVRDPVAYFGAALALAFEKEGVRVLGETRPQETLPPGAWWRAAEHRTDLLTTLEVVNRRSQNFYAESLVKLLGAHFCQDGSWQAGLDVLAEFLLEAGISGEFSLADGSGMSRTNRFTARQLTDLLTHMFEHPYAREFLASLPYSGLEDHRRWRTRLAEPPYRANVFAKTGSLNGVSTLSGYVKASSGKVYAFSILCNEVPSVASARRAQDSIVRALIDHG